MLIQKNTDRFFFNYLNQLYVCGKINIKNRQKNY